MPGHGGWLLGGELIGAGFLALAVVLVALLALTAILHAGRSHAPARLRVRVEDDRRAGDSR